MIESEADFIREIERIDADLVAKGVPLDLRSFQAILEIGKSATPPFVIDSVSLTASGPPRPGVYSGRDLIIRVREWYSKRLGTTRGNNLRLGKIAVLLCGDPWGMTVPLSFGTINVICDPSQTAVIDRKRTLNLVDRFDSLPTGIRSAARPSEWQACLDVFVAALRGFDLLRQGPGLKAALLKQAFSDFEATVYHLVHEPRNCGQARWTSLQGVEKVLKMLLVHRTGTYPKQGHQLLQLVVELESTGWPAIDRKLINTVQCNAAVRYGEVQVSLAEAIDAHHASIRLLNEFHQTGLFK